MSLGSATRALSQQGLNMPMSSPGIGMCVISSEMKVAEQVSSESLVQTTTLSFSAKRPKAQVAGPAKKEAPSQPAGSRDKKVHHWLRARAKTSLEPEKVPATCSQSGVQRKYRLRNLGLRVGSASKATVMTVLGS
jgi:hypothetical protein